MRRILMAITTVLVMLFSACTLVMLFSACTRGQLQKERLYKELAGARQSLDFGARYTHFLELADSIARAYPGTDLAYFALYVKAQLHLDLFLAVLVTDSSDLYELLKSVLGRKLNGPFRTVINYQVLIQDIMEEFRLIVREVPSGALHDKAKLLADFSNAIQAVFYTDREYYLKVLAQVEAEPEFSHYARLMVLFDLFHETIDSGKEPYLQWKRIAYGVLTHMCKLAACGFVDTLCSVGIPPDKVKEHPECPQDIRVFDKDTLIRLLGKLNKHCDLPEAVGKVSADASLLDKVRVYYEFRIGQLLSSRDPLVLYLKDRILRWQQRLGDAVNYIGRSFLLFKGEER